jgi:glycosyltransferase involved in cell wall biosynthesis
VGEEETALSKEREEVSLSPSFHKLAAFGLASAQSIQIATYMSAERADVAAQSVALGCGPAGSLPLRILKVTQSYYPFLARGGPAVKVRAMARGLARRSHVVTVLTSDLGLPFANGGTVDAVEDRRGWRALDDSVETIYLRSWAHYRSLTWNPGVSRFCRLRLAPFDIVHIYGLYDLLGPTVARACRRLGIPYVLEPMGMYRPIVRNIPLKRAYRRWFGVPMTRGAVRLIATSAQEQKELVEEGILADKVVVRRNGIEPPESPPVPGSFRRRWDIPDDAALVLFLGRLVPKKSPELLLEAFARWQAISPRGRTARLVLAGPSEDQRYREKLGRDAARLQLTGQVLFPGPLYEDAKWSAYRDADVFVLPSQNENFGNTAAEAIACGTPVLVTNRCGIAPLVEGRAGLVTSYDRDALADSLSRSLDDSALRESLRKRCAEVMRELSWAEPLSETEALYAEIARQSRRFALVREPIG